LREFVYANNVKTFISSYKKLLEHQPNCTPQVIQECNYIYQDSLIQGKPSGFVSKNKCSTMLQSQ